MKKTMVFQTGTESLSREQLAFCCGLVGAVEDLAQKLGIEAPCMLVRVAFDPPTTFHTKPSREGT